MGSYEVFTTVRKSTHKYPSKIFTAHTHTHAKQMDSKKRLNSP